MEDRGIGARTGLTVRALHHYDHKGLVTPSKSSDSGHRLYTEADIARLQQVLSLKQLGFALIEVMNMKANNYFTAEQLSGRN